MKNTNEFKKESSVTFRISKQEAENLQNEANTELLSISALVRRKIFYNGLKAAI